MVPTRDFGVSMSREVLEHKLRDGKMSQGRYCYWTFPREIPVGIETGSRMWVANGGRWVGYFDIRGGLADNEVEFYSESFVRKYGGPRSPFRGFTWKVPPRSR